ncbi:MAG: hypothetical protein ACJ73S_01460 [Mycobacteriales bacterium]
MWLDAWNLLIALPAERLAPALRILHVEHLRAMLANADVSSDADLADFLYRHQIERIAQVSNGPKDAKSGVWYPYAYRSKYPKEFEALPDAREGVASPAHFERIGHMHRRLLPGVSATAGCGRGSPASRSGSR